MLAQHRTERFEFRARVGRARRVAGAVEHEHASPWRDRGGELRGGDLVALLGPRVRHDRDTVGQQRHVRVRHPVRGRDDDFVARVDHGHEQVVDCLLGARRHEDLRARVRDGIVATEFRDDRILELRDAFDGGVARKAIADRLKTPASAMCAGVSKSGSPTPRPMMSWPSALRRATRPVRATVGEGLTRRTRSARWTGTGRGSGGEKDPAF
jgi:hypothetical protein